MVSATNQIYNSLWDNEGQQDKQMFVCATGSWSPSEIIALHLKIVNLRDISKVNWVTHTTKTIITLGLVNIGEYSLDFVSGNTYQYSELLLSLL